MLSDIAACFTECQGITPLNVLSGQKDVFRAVWRGRTVALKLIRKAPAEAQRIEREIEAVVKLQSAYVPLVFEYGQRSVLGSDRHYLIEQFIEGETLRQRLAGGRVSTAFSVDLLRTLLRACVDFENARLIHRDIKPENLILESSSDKLWIIDFGLARHRDLTSVTPSGPGGMGTPGYAPPEQFRNLKRDLDSRADLFSCGVVTYEALTGTNPYLHPPNDVLSVIRRMDAADLPPISIPGDVSGSLSQFLASITARFPSRRPRTAAEALAWFEAVT